MRYALLFLLFTSFTQFAKAQEILHKVVISSGDEDADEQAGFVQIYDLELDIGWENQNMSRTALFFRNMYLSPNADISGVNLSLTAETSFFDSIAVAIRVEENPFPSPIVDSLSLVANRSFINDSVVWIIPPTEKNQTTESPELLTLLQPLFDDPEWNASSGVYLLIEPIGQAPDSGNIEFLAFSYDQTELTFRPTLNISVDSNDINGINYQSHTSSAFAIYPNPASDYLIVDFVNNIASSNSILITDINGRLMLPPFKTISNQTRIDISALSPGIYFLKEEQTNKALRFVKVNM